MTAADPRGRSQKVVALDLGEVRTGVAVSDGILARPLEVVPSRELESYLGVLLARDEVGEVVVGVPKTMGGEIGAQARQVLDTLDALRGAFPAVCFVEWDERLTTKVARSGGQKGRRRKGGSKKERVDHLAAAVMLQEYLDRRGSIGAARLGPAPTAG